MFRKNLTELWGVCADKLTVGDNLVDPIAARMKAFLGRVASGPGGSFLTRIAVICTAESLYLTWAKAVTTPEIQSVGSGEVSASPLQVLYAQWIYPFHSGNDFETVVCDFVEAFNDAWTEADDDDRAKCKIAIEEMLELEFEFTEILMTGSGDE